MDRSLLIQMYNIETTHWWFCARRNIITFLINSYFEEQIKSSIPLSICDLGLGTGVLLKELSPLGEVYGLDQSDVALEYAKSRGLENVYIGNLPDQVPFPENNFDLVLLLDVVEHVKKDSEAVRRALSLLRRKGILICTVPAYNYLWTARDDLHGHKRRYNKETFRRLFPDDFVQVCLFTYFNSLLFPLAAIFRIASKGIPESWLPSDLGMVQPSGFINKVLMKVFSLEKHIIQRFNLPFGLSLLCVVQRK